MSNTIAVMSEGKIIEMGDPRQIYDHPVTEFTASFVGSTNRIEGKLGETVDCGAYRSLSTGIGALICPVREALAVGEKVVLLVRPQDVSVSRDGFEKSENMFEARLVEQVFLGEYIDCLLEIEDLTTHAYINPRANFRVGEQLFVHFPPDLCVVIPS